MKVIIGIVVGILLALPAAGEDRSFFPGGIYEWHDKDPHRGGIKDSTGDNECNEQHHLTPDGDHDCDDPKSVPEPGSLGLLALGLGALALARRRR